jgi:hypothetical protein
MRKPEGYKSRIELLQGMLDMLILQTLRRGPQQHSRLKQLSAAIGRRMNPSEERGNA